MSEIRSALEVLRADRIAEQPDARIEDDFVELDRVVVMAEVERLRRLAELDRRAIYRRDGHLSAASWLVASFGVGWGAAMEQVRVARGLEEMPKTKRALDAGDLSLSAVRVLVTARDADPVAFARCEAELVEAARIHQIRDLQRVAAHWRQAVGREDGRRGEDELRCRRRLHASQTFEGMVRVDGDLDPETGESLLTALRAIMDAEARSGADDQRTPAQRRADALGEICRQWLDGSDRPQVAGERPHVTVTVGLDALRDVGGPGEAGWFEGAPASAVDGASVRDPDRASGRPGEMDHTGWVHPEAVRLLACDASITRVVMAGRSEPLDVGRRTPVVSPAMRRAVIVRDRHCRFPSCDRPQTWCDAHHVVHWADGGPAAVANLVLFVPPASPDGARGRWVPAGPGRRTTGVQETGRVAARRTGPAVGGWGGYHRAMLLVALTGGLGSGKSTVGGMLAERGAVVIEADDLARRAVEPGTSGLRKLVEEFGTEILDTDGRLDRRRMADLAFADPEARQRLEAVTHPEVARLLQEALDPLRDTDRVVVYEVPLLVERRLQDAFDVVVTVSAPVEDRVRRVAERLPEDDARARIAAQVSDEAREAVADVVLRNDGTVQDLRGAVDALWSDLRARAG